MKLNWYQLMQAEKIYHPLETNENKIETEMRFKRKTIYVYRVYKEKEDE